jgi:hypothetical protein
MFVIGTYGRQISRSNPFYILGIPRIFESSLYISRSNHLYGGCIRKVKSNLIYHVYSIFLLL